MSELSQLSKKPGSGGTPPSLPHLNIEHGKPHEDHSEGNWLVSYADMMTLLVGFFVILLSFSTLDPQKFEEARKSISIEFGGKFQVPYSNLAASLRDLVKKLGIGDQFIIKESEIGIEISSRGTMFFDTGSADLKEEAVPLLAKVVEAIKFEPTQFDITVEGHTDDVPFASSHSVIHNNFELSSLRACRVLESFVAADYPKTHLTALGFGDTRPLVPNRDKDGNAIAENQAQNRRVVIKIVKAPEPVLPPKSEAGK